MNMRAVLPGSRARVPDTGPVSSALLDPLSRRIVGALQVDGRASWRKIAEVLDEPVRTVARRGAALLEERTVQVVGLPNTDPTHLLRIRCRAGATARVAAAVAGRRDTVFVYALGRAPEIVVEVMTPYAALAALVLDELPALDGVEEVQVDSALLYFRTIAEWLPGLLSAEEIAALGGVPPSEPFSPETQFRLDDAERTLLDALAADGRAPLQEIAELLGCSDATARRRVEQLVERGVLRIRAVVEPALLGLPVETLLRVRVHPTKVDAVGRALVSSPLVRYCTFVAGEDQLLVDVTTPDVDGLRALLTDPAWIGGADQVVATPLLRAYKRGSVLVDPSVGSSHER
jgi:DNA-binding Lrp family transcriptional regulator